VGSSGERERAWVQSERDRASVGLPETEREKPRLPERERKGEGRLGRQCRFKFGAKFFPSAEYVGNTILFYNKNERKMLGVLLVCFPGVLPVLCKT
jgi:hypothetical protein